MTSFLDSTKAYATYVVTEDELRQAALLYESICVFDKRTPFSFITPDPTAVNFRRLDDSFSRFGFNVVTVPWPEQGIPYKSVWQVPHTLVNAELVMFLSCNVIVNRDLQWMFELFKKYSAQVKSAVGFGVDQHTTEIIPDVFMYSRSNADTWLFFESVRDIKASTWNEAAFYLAKAWHHVRGEGLVQAPSPAFKLYPLTLLSVTPSMVGRNRPPNVLVNGLPSVDNLRVVPNI